MTEPVTCWAVSWEPPVGYPSVGRARRDAGCASLDVKKIPYFAGARRWRDVTRPPFCSTGLRRMGATEGGVTFVGEVMDPKDGLVWLWQLAVLA